MLETIETIVTIEQSRERVIRQQAERLNARVVLLNREREGFEQARKRLQSGRNSKILAHQKGQPVTVFELQLNAAQARLIDQQINEALENEANREEQLSLARTRAQRCSERLAKCLRRQAKFEEAIKRMGKQKKIRQERLDEAQIEHLVAMQWQARRER